MYKNFKVVVNTAVGRRRYLKLLFPQVLSSEIVDRYDLWINTLDKIDIAFFEAVAQKYPKVNLIWQPQGIINGIYSIAEFYSFCQEENTIYIKLDDDIVWIDPTFFEEICRFRVDNPQYFLISPLVINNGICNYILQNRELIKFNQNISCQAYDMKFYNGYIAKEIHEWFIANYLKNQSYSRLYCGEQIVSLQRFAINAVAWFGGAMKKFDGKVIGDDEEFLTVEYPGKHNLISCFDCNTIVSHFSFSVQRSFLDTTSILNEYESIIKNFSTKKINSIFKEIGEIIIEVEKDSESILSKPIPHNYVKGKKKKGRHENLYKLLEKISFFFFIPKVHRRHFIHLYLGVVRYKRNYIQLG